MLSLVSFRPQHAGRQVLPGVENRSCLEGTALAPVVDGEPRLEQHPERLEQEIFGQVPVDTHQPFAAHHVNCRWRDQFIQRWEGPLGELRVAECFEQGPVQGVAAEVVSEFRIGAAREQRLHQRHVTRRRGGYQRRLIHERAVVDAVAVALLQDVLEARREVSDKMLAAERRPLLREGPGGVETCLARQPGGQHGFVIADGVLVELLFGLSTRGLLAEYLGQRVAEPRFVEYRPGYRRLPENALTDGIGLLLLALQFELACFLLPVV